MRLFFTLSALTVFAALGLSAPLARAETIGEVGVDWTGNDIIIEAVSDPKVTGVTCHVAYFDRGMVDRLKNGNWFEDPSNNSIACRQTGAIVIGDIDGDENGETVFSQRQSLVFKSVKVTRVYDKANNTLIYLAHGNQVQDGSAKMSMSTVPLYKSGAIWKDGRASSN